VLFYSIFVFYSASLLFFFYISSHGVFRSVLCSFPLIRESASERGRRGVWLRCLVWLLLMTRSVSVLNKVSSFTLFKHSTLPPSSLPSFTFFPFLLGVIRIMFGAGRWVGWGGFRSFQICSGWVICFLFSQHTVRALFCSVLLPFLALFFCVC